MYNTIDFLSVSKRVFYLILLIGYETKFRFLIIDPKMIRTTSLLSKCHIYFSKRQNPQCLSWIGGYLVYLISVEKIESKRAMNGNRSSTVNLKMDGKKSYTPCSSNVGRTNRSESLRVSTRTAYCKTFGTRGVTRTPTNPPVPAHSYSRVYYHYALHYSTVGFAFRTRLRRDRVKGASLPTVKWKITRTGARDLARRHVLRKSRAIFFQQ